MRYLVIVAALLAFVAGVQPRECAAQAKPAAPAIDYRSSAAYAEVRLRQAEIEAELESSLSEYTEDHPKVREARVSLALLQKEIERLSAAGPAAVSRMTAAVGKLMVRKVEAETDLQKLLEALQPAHPDAKKAKRKVEVFEAAIRDVLGK